MTGRKKRKRDRKKDRKEGKKEGKMRGIKEIQRKMTGGTKARGNEGRNKNDTKENDKKRKWNCSVHYFNGLQPKNK